MPTPIPPTILADYSRRLTAAYAHARKIMWVALSPAASQLWADDLYDEFSGADDDDNAASEFTRRAAPYCLRIAALYAVLDGRAEITPADLTAAAALVRYSIDSARYVLARRSTDPRVDRIRRAVDQAGEDGLTRTAVSVLFSRNLPARVLDALLKTLLEDELYEEFAKPTGGRPAQAYRRKPSTS